MAIGHAFAPVIATGDIPGLDTVELGDAERNLRRKTHTTIRRVSDDLHPRVHLNTAVSALMELVNDLYGYCEKMNIGPMSSDPDEAIQKLVLVACRSSGRDGSSCASVVAVHTAFG
ncbi:MAG: hypothetical protein Ct9H300mP25_13130 [Acidobacteriota bacterium]|nr:MAG: hypothetical protein Ct9H300mP25_13130 [Acidobacteriota bacterium]